MSKYLKKIVKALETEAQSQPQMFNFAIPDTWLSFDYKGQKIQVHDGNVLVNPYHFYRSLIKDVFLKEKPAHLAGYYTQNEVPYGLQNGDWIKASSVYSMMIRSSGAYDHDRTGYLMDKNFYDLRDTGTFIKTLALLPNLKRIGIDVLYLLPIAKYSLKDKKGELGSPYGVANFTALDPLLKDPMTSDHTSVEDEFKAFVEAAHALDMKVVIDIIPRTNSVNSDLIVDHPDWFYWIDLKDLKNYAPPMVEGLKDTLPAKKEYFKDLFSSPNVEEHLHKFRKNPKELNAEKWEELVKIYKSEDNQKEILDLVQQMFKMSVAPAFSDHINDPQPAWSDVTYFRLYLDHPANSQPYLKKLGEFEPYILFDVAKASYNPGTKPNKALWKLLSDVIPYYQTSFGIDGARIDMGHALPPELITMIIDKAKSIDPNFSFIAEELDPENAKASIAKGYNMIIGNGFIMEPRITEGKFNEFVYSTRTMASAVFACGETHDTPRLAARKGEEVLAKMLTIFNLFLPNAVPFINSGQEVFEVQPMNTGVDCGPHEAEALALSDPLYGKLALFDRYSFHYLHPRRWEMVEAIESANKLRQQLLPTLLKPKSIKPLGFSAPWDLAAGFAYPIKGTTWLVIANTDCVNDKIHHVKLDNLAPSQIKAGTIVEQLYSSEKNQTDETIVIQSDAHIDLSFKKGEVKVLRIKN